MIFRNPESIIELHQIFQIINPIGNFYPDFKNWYFDKVIPGTVLGQDKIIVAEKNNEIVGVSIIKNAEYEKKLRAVRISEKFQNKGYGLFLIDEALKQLNCDKPAASVAEEMINEYARIFVERYDFSLDHVHKGLYRRNKLEYSFNENVSLKQKSIYF